MTDQATFLARVRQAAQAGRAYRVHAAPRDPSIAYLGTVGDLCEQLAAEIDAVGGQALLVDDLPAAADTLRTLLATAQARSALCWKHPLLQLLGLPALLADARIQRWDAETLDTLPPGERRTRLLACDVGITSCDVAIAESGTLVMCARPGQERSASLLPPWHIAIVHRRQIVPDLLDALNLLASWAAPPAPSTPTSSPDGVNFQSPAPGMANVHPPAANPADMPPPVGDDFLPQLPSNITLITGPSKTGDMELQLTTGVHGPAHWRVIVVRD